MQHSVKVFLGSVDLVLFNNYYNHSYCCGQLSPLKTRVEPGESLLS